jgi:hypothetical protein
MTKIRKHKAIYDFIAVIRIASGPLIFFWPFIVIVLQTVLDLIDGEFASKKVTTWKQYQYNDKILDTWWYIWSYIFALVYLPGHLGLLSVFFFYRLLGKFIFIRTHKRYLLFLFPNFFENIFILIFMAKYFNLNYLLEGQIFFWIVVGNIVFKFFHEWWLHIAQLSFMEVFFKKKKNWR